MVGEASERVGLRADGSRLPSRGKQFPDQTLLLFLWMQNLGSIQTPLKDCRKTSAEFSDARESSKYNDSVREFYRNIISALQIYDIQV